MFPRPSSNWDLTDTPPPWGDRPSIYERLRADPSAGFEDLAAADASAADEQGGWIRALIRRATDEMVAEDLADALAAVDLAMGDLAADELADALGRDWPSAEARAAASIFGALKRATLSASPGNVRKLHDAVLAGSTIEYVVPFLQLLVADATVDGDRVRALAKWFAEGAADPEPVKWALATLGVVSRDEVDLLLTLGRHEAFAYYAVRAAHMSVREPDRLIGELAKHLGGWDRVHAIWHLAGTADDEIRSWMLREGFDHVILNTLTAYIRATSGGLLGALSKRHLDDALLKGAGEIFRALISEDALPDSGMSDYGDGVAAVETYLGHVLRSAGTLQQFVVVDDLRRWCSDCESSWSALAARGWTLERLAGIERDARAFLARDHWRTLVMAGLESSDAAEFDTAIVVARALGLDTWDHQFRRLVRGEDRWLGVMQTDDPERVERVIALALERIPLAEIATGPEDEDGVGPRFHHHRKLGCVVERLDRFPGKGLTLVHAALRSPSFFNRSAAVNALIAWGESRWGLETQALLEAAGETEPDERLRERMGKLLAGEWVD